MGTRNPRRLIPSLLYKRKQAPAQANEGSTKKTTCGDIADRTPPKPVPPVPCVFQKPLKAPQILEQQPRQPQLESICVRCRSACENGKRVPPWAQQHEGVLAVKRAIENKQCISVGAAERFHFETCVLPVMANVLKVHLFVLDPADIDDTSPDPMNSARLWATTSLKKGLKVLLVRSFEAMPSRYLTDLRELANNNYRTASIVVHHAVNMKRDRIVFPENTVRLYAGNYGSKRCPIVPKGDEFNDIFKGAEKVFAHAPGDYSQEQIQLVVDTELERHFEQFAPTLSSIECLPTTFQAATVQLAVRKQTRFQKMSSLFQKTSARHQKRSAVDTFSNEIGSRNPHLSRDDMFYLSIIGCFDPEAGKCLTLPGKDTFKEFLKKVRPIFLS